MRKKWKTRWNTFWRDRYVHQMVWYPTMIASSVTGIMSVFGNGDVSPLFAAVFTQLAFVIGVYGALLIELLLDEEHPYDEDMHISILNESVSSVPELTEKEIHESIDRIVRMHYHVQQEERDETMQERIHTLVGILHHCKQYESLTKEETYTLFVTIPQEICHTLTLYNKLTKENKQKMKQQIHNYMKKQTHSIVHTYMYPAQEVLQRGMEKQMKRLQLPMDGKDEDE